jgi:hypothetical protein
LVEKLSFEISNAELIEENPNSNFALLSLDFFASGKNKHDTYVSEETLLGKADSIKNCPVVWKYDPVLDDVGTHDPEETPCGFIPQTTEIKSRKLADGRTMLSVLSYVWKKYSGRLLEFFKRDGDKPVSVEMSVYDSAMRPDRFEELKDFRFEAVTILGSFTTPAIPMAKATVLQFSQEYMAAYEKEFARYEGIDFTIPEDVKKNAQKALDIHKKGKESSTSVALAMARFLIKSDKITPEKVRQMAKFFNKKAEQSELSTGFYGGSAGARWSKKLYKAIEQTDAEKVAYFDSVGDAMSEELTFPYTKIGDINPALKGIDPPITLGQANAIAKQADAVGQSDKVNGWAVAISSFKKTHKVENGKWVEKKKMSEGEEPGDEKEMSMEKTKEEMAAEEEAKKLENAAPEESKEDPKEEEKETPEEEKKEEMAKPEEGSPEEEKKETPEEEKKEDKEEKMSLNAYVDVAALLAYLQAETDDNEEIAAKYAEAKEEVSKEYAAPDEKFCNGGKVMAAMYAKMCKMAEKMAAKDVEMSELKAYKADIEKQQKEMAVNAKLKEMAEKSVIPEEAMAEMRASAEKYSYAELTIWENECKAKAFDFAVKETGGEKHVKIAIPYIPSVPRPQNDIWAGTKKSN